MQVRKERDSAVKACESAYEAGELLKEQLSFLMREKEIAEAQVSDHWKPFKGGSPFMLGRQGSTFSRAFA